MAITKNTDTNTSGQFTADKDYYGETEDGRQYLKVAQGVTIPMAEAVEMGVVKGKTAKTEEPETADDGEKSDEPASNKGASPSKNKGGAKNG